MIILLNHFFHVLFQVIDFTISFLFRLSYLLWYLGFLILDLEPQMSEILSRFTFLMLHRDHAESDIQMSITISFLPKRK